MTLVDPRHSVIYRSNHKYHINQKRPSYCHLVYYRRKSTIWVVVMNNTIIWPRLLADSRHILRLAQGRQKTSGAAFVMQSCGNDTLEFVITVLLLAEIRKVRNTPQAVWMKRLNPHLIGGIQSVHWNLLGFELREIGSGNLHTTYRIHTATSYDKFSGHSIYTHKRHRAQLKVTSY